MEKILFVDACARPDSRTRELAQTLLQGLEGEVEHLPLYALQLQPLDMAGLARREDPAAEFDLAKQFAAADTVVIAAPYWDLMFPAVLKLYLEQITVSGVTFCYTPQGRPQGLCRGKTMYYVATSGGPMGDEPMGYAYVKALATQFYGFSQVHLVKAEGLDIWGQDPRQILDRAKAALWQRQDH